MIGQVEGIYIERRVGVGEITHITSTGVHDELKEHVLIHPFF